LQKYTEAGCDLRRITRYDGEIRSHGPLTSVNSYFLPASDGTWLRMRISFF